MQNNSKEDFLYEVHLYDCKDNFLLQTEADEEIVEYALSKLQSPQGSSSFNDELVEKLRNLGYKTNVRYVKRIIL